MFLNIFPDNGMLDKISNEKRDSRAIHSILETYYRDLTKFHRAPSRSNFASEASMSILRQTREMNKRDEP